MGHMGFALSAQSVVRECGEGYNATLRVVPCTLDPECTPIPPGVCAMLLGLTRPEHDQLVRHGVIEQSREVSPFGGEDGTHPLLMSNYWDLTRAAMVLRLRRDHKTCTALLDAMSDVLDDVARSSDLLSLDGKVSADDLFDACWSLEKHASGLALLVAYTITSMSRRLMALQARRQDVWGQEAILLSLRSA